MIDVRNPNTSSVEYRVHYAGWNTRYDEWIKCDAIISVIGKPAADAATPAAGKQKQSSSAVSVILLYSIMFPSHLFHQYFDTTGWVTRPVSCT